MSSYFWTNETNTSTTEDEKKSEVKNSASESDLSNKNLLECFANEPIDTNLTSCFSDPELHSKSFLSYLTEESQKEVDTDVDKSDVFVITVDDIPVKYTKTEKEAAEYIFNESKEYLMDLSVDVANNYYLQFIDHDHVNIICVPKFFFLRYCNTEISYKYFKIQSL